MGRLKLMVVTAMLTAAVTAQGQLAVDSISAAGGQTMIAGTAVMAQNPDYVPVAPFEGELWLLGFTFPMSIDSGNMFGWDAGVELRHNKADSPLSYGGMVGIYVVPEWKKGAPGVLTTAGGGLIFGPVIEYGWGRGNRYSTYASVSTGVSSNGNTGSSLYLRPKVGVEFFNLARFSLSCFYSGKGSLSMSVNVGLIMGGWPKK